MTEKEFDANSLIGEIDDIKIDSTSNIENLTDELSSINSELMKINRQLEDISESLRERSEGISVGHFSIGIFCVCLAVIFF